MKVSIDLPDVKGFEPDGGIQPRVPKKGEWYRTLTSNDHACECEHDSYRAELIILKRIEPEYKTYRGSFAGQASRYVEVKALEDALSMIDSLNSGPEFDLNAFGNYKLLNDLVKGGDS